MMLGGKYKYSLFLEEYIFVVFNLYLDIVNFFFFILFFQINGEVKFILFGFSIFNKYFNEWYIIVEVNVIESLIKIILSGNSKIQFYQYVEKMEFFDLNFDIFKFGFFYIVYVSIGVF